MENWVTTPLILKGDLVDLIHLQKKHIPEIEILGKAKAIWQHYVLDGSDSEVIRNAFNDGITQMENGSQFAFVIYHHSDQKIIGSTRFLDIQQSQKKLEIGWTWLHPHYWGTKVNFECKLLLLTYCFETLGAYRVQLKTDKLNMRSRKAIEKVGGQFEGILRNDMIRDDGSKRDSAYYSIINSEWEEVKKRLIRKLEAI
jgi:RimJ/RimL family protein N-acetyltransferase